MTPSQEKAINRQKRIFLLIHPDAKFSVRYQRISRLYNTSELHLTAEYSLPNSLDGKPILMWQSWTIGERGKVTKVWES